MFYAASVIVSTHACSTRDLVHCAGPQKANQGAVTKINFPVTGEFRAIKIALNQQQFLIFTGAFDQDVIRTGEFVGRAVHLHLGTTCPACACYVYCADPAIGEEFGCLF